MLTHHCQHSHVDLWLAMLEFVTLSWFCCINVVLYHNQKSERHGSGNLAGQVIELPTLLKSPLINNMFIRVVKIYWRVLYMVQHFQFTLSQQLTFCCFVSSFLLTKCVENRGISNSISLFQSLVLDYRCLMFPASSSSSHLVHLLGCNCPPQLYRQAVKEQFLQPVGRQYKVTKLSTQMVFQYHRFISHSNIELNCQEHVGLQLMLYCQHAVLQSTQSFIQPTI